MAYTRGLQTSGNEINVSTRLLRVRKRIMNFKRNLGKLRGILKQFPLLQLKQPLYNWLSARLALRLPVNAKRQV